MKPTTKVKKILYNLNRILVLLMLLFSATYSYAQTFSGFALGLNNTNSSIRFVGYNGSVWLALASPTNVNGIRPLPLTNDGTFIYAVTGKGFSGTQFIQYDITFDIWTTLNSPNLSDANFAITHLGTDIYALGKDNTTNANAFLKYSGGTWTALTAPNVGIYNILLTATTTNVYALTFPTGGFNPQFSKFSAGAWTTLAAPNVQVGTSTPMAMTSDGTNIYLLGTDKTTATFTFYKFDGTAWSKLSSPASLSNINLGGTGPVTLSYDGTNILVLGAGITNTTSYGKYDSATDSWSLIYTSTGSNDITKGSIPNGLGLTAIAGCTPTVTSINTIDPTCTGGVANNDAQISVSGITGGVKYGYSTGGTYSGPDFNSAISFTGSSFTITGLNNPGNDYLVPYTVRVFCDANGFVDKTVVLTHKKCRTADLSLVVSPTTSNAAKGEIITYTYTLTNSGPDLANNIKVKVQMPSTEATFVAAETAQGTYNQTTQLWDVGTLANGASTTLTFTLKVN